MLNLPTQVPECKWTPLLVCRDQFVTSHDFVLPLEKLTSITDVRLNKFKSNECFWQQSRWHSTALMVSCRSSVIDL